MIEGVWKQDSQENIWTLKRGSNKRI